MDGARRHAESLSGSIDACLFEDFLRLTIDRLWKERKNQNLAATTPAGRDRSEMLAQFESQFGADRLNEPMIRVHGGWNINPDSRRLAPNGAHSIVSNDAGNFV